MGNKLLYSIEYYPLAKKYYAKYKDQYISVSYSTGIPELEDRIMYAKKFDKEEDAEHLIELHKEYQTKKGVSVIISKHN